MGNSSHEESHQSRQFHAIGHVITSRQTCKVLWTFGIPISGVIKVQMRDDHRLQQVPVSREHFACAENARSM